MHFLIEISYEPAAADSLRTLVLEAGEKFSTAMSGKKSGDCRLESAWRWPAARPIWSSRATMASRSMSSVTR